uniref:InsA N-terminal zinc ribbon domain-containing protein n=1 Tax=Enterobacter cloacae TaxID=550 RepID=A0A2S1JHF5_ENTCL|nr:Hypothetical protein [Enterobacter cloacae]
MRNGKSTAGHQRYLCSHCRKTWQLQFTGNGALLNKSDFG